MAWHTSLKYFILFALHTARMEEHRHFKKTFEAQRDYVICP